jgi:hypothetical protein
LGLFCCAQKGEHYEIASYGSLCELARVLGFKDQRQVLASILEEEKATDIALTRLAEGNVNPTARARKLCFGRKRKACPAFLFSRAVGRLKPFDQRRAYDDLVLIKHGFEAFAAVSPPSVIEIRGHNFDNNDLIAHDLVFIFGLAGSGRPCDRRGAAKHVG